MSAPSSGWRWIAVQSSSVSVRPRSATRSDSANRPMSCSSRRYGQVPTRRRSSRPPWRCRARTAPPRPSDARRAVADIQRPHQAGEHAPGQRHVLLGPWRDCSSRWAMYENANTAASAKAMPSLPTFPVMPTPATTTRMLAPALGRNSIKVSSRIALRSRRAGAAARTGRSSAGRRPRRRARPPGKSRPVGRPAQHAHDHGRDNRGNDRREDCRKTRTLTTSSSAADAAASAITAAGAADRGPRNRPASTRR